MKEKHKRGTNQSSKNIPHNKIINVKQNVSSNWFAFIQNDSKISRKAVRPMLSEDILKPKTGRTSRKPSITKVLSLDCEMVSDMKDRNMLGRVSVVNFKLECVYDKFVKPTAPVGDCRTRFSGLRKEDLENGSEFSVVQREVIRLLRNKMLVGHALKNDFRVLKYWHDNRLVRDTSKYPPFRNINSGKTPSLKNLAKSFLAENVQQGEHNSVEDARTAMKLYIKYRHEWELSITKGSTTFSN